MLLASVICNFILPECMSCASLASDLIPFQGAGLFLPIALTVKRQEKLNSIKRLSVDSTTLRGARLK